MKSPPHWKIRRERYLRETGKLKQWAREVEYGKLRLLRIYGHVAALREFYERKYGRAGAEKLWRCMQADHAVLQAKRLLENHMPLAVSAADRYRLLRRVRTAELRFWKLLQELAKRRA